MIDEDLVESNYMKLDNSHYLTIESLLNSEYTVIMNILLDHYNLKDIFFLESTLENFKFN